MEKEFVPFFKSFKFIPTEKNNPIGIIVNPRSADLYENAISFFGNDGNYSESLRNTFVGRELFNNTSWQDLFNLIETNAQLVSDVKATFKVSYDDFKKLYPNQPASSLLNKDYGILQININNQTKEYMFYQIENAYTDPTNEGTYIFEGSLDIYMTYGSQLKTKPGSQVFVKRAHIDRLDDRGFYKFFMNNIIETNLLNVEPDFRSNLKKFGFFWNDISFEVLGNTEISRKKLEEYLQTLKWELFYRVLSESYTGEETKKFHYLYEQTTGLKIYFGCYITHPEIFEWNIELAYYINNVLSKTVGIIPNKNNNYQKIIGNADLSKNHIISSPPFNQIGISKVTFDFAAKKITFHINTIELGVESETGDFENIPFRAYINTVPVKWDNLKLPVPHIVGPEELSNVTMETTLFSSQFFKIIYGISNHSYAELALDYLLVDSLKPDETVDCFYGYSWQPDVNEEWIKIEEQLKNYNSISQNFYKTTNGTSRILTNSAWDEYLKTSQVSSITAAAFKSGMVGLGAGFGLYKGFGKDRGFGRAGLGASLLVTAGGLSGIANELATRADIKNKPDQLKGSENIAFYDEWDKNGIVAYYVYKRLNNSNLSQIWNFLKMFGKEVNTLLDYNEIIKSRFFYNFIQCEGLFNVLDNFLSTKIKQQLDTDAKKGIRFWHYRSSEMFKGVGNYQNENIEMSLLKKSFVKILSTSTTSNSILVNLDIFNDPKYNVTPLVVEYSMNGTTWTPLTAEEITNKSFNVTQGLTPDGLYTVYVRTNNPAYIDNPISKNVRTERAAITSIKIELATEEMFISQEKILTIPQTIITMRNLTAYTDIGNIVDGRTVNANTILKVNLPQTQTGICRTWIECSFNSNNITYKYNSDNCVYMLCPYSATVEINI